MSKKPAALNRLGPCAKCQRANEDPIFRFPTHLVHPEHGKPMTFDIRSEAVCPDCGTLWRSNPNNTVEVLR